MTAALAYDETPSELVGGEGHGLLTLPNGQSIAARFHELAEMLPMMDGAAFQSLVEDIKTHGVRRPIVLFEGQILDGRNRYLAAREAGVGYPVVEFTGADAAAFVKSENFHRRHLTESQKAMFAAKYAKLSHGGDRRSDQAARVPLEMTQAEAAAEFEVSERSVRSAKAVLDHGAPELAKAVTGGEVSVRAAAAVATLPAEEQAEIVAKGPEAVVEAAKEVRQAKAKKPEPEGGSDAQEAERRKLQRMTPDARIDEIMGLRAALAETKADSKKLKDERDQLKARVAELSESDHGAVVRRLQKAVESANHARWKAEEKAGAWSRQVHTLKKRVSELENTGIEVRV